jgi:D-alanyl-D-alanine carboxypeptidase
MIINYLNKTNQLVTGAMIGIVLIFIMAVSVSCTDRSMQPDLRAKSPQELDLMLDAEMRKYNIPGLIFGVWVNGQKPWIQSKGKADIKAEKVIATSDKVRIGSITKTFVATVLLQLVDEGKISLDDPLSKHIHYVPNAENITIRQLLNHTSGLADYEDLIFEDYLSFDPLKKWTPSELVIIGLSRKPYFAPGKGWHYSNTGYVLLGMIIEQITGDTIGNEIKKRILDPLGLKNTSFPTDSAMEGDYARGYWFKQNDGGLKDITNFDPSCEWDAGAMISTLDDLKVWLDALTQGKLLSQAMHSEQMTWVNAFYDGPIPVKYGLGVVNYGGFIGHTGAVPGYETAMLSSPSEKTTLIVFVNRFGPNLSESILMPLLHKYYLLLYTPQAL